MSNIPISQIVQVPPRVVGAGGAQGTLDGLILSTDSGLAASQPQVFYSASDVSDFFGPTSPEAEAAAVYFPGIVGGGQQPGSLTFARFAGEDDLPAAVFGAELALSLAQLQDLSGTLSVTTSAPFVSATIDLAAATSFANAATLMTAGFTSPDFAITYDSQRRRFVLATTATGAAASVTAVTGTLATDVGLSATAGAYVQATGVSDDTLALAMTRAVDGQPNWATFTTTTDVGLAGRVELADWTGKQDFQYLYFSWEADVAGLTTNNPASFGAIVQSTPYQGTTPLYGTLLDAAGALAWAASVNFQAVEGREAFAFRQRVASDVPSVTSLADANALLSNGYSYYGRYASAANQYTIYYDGKVGGQFVWADTFLNQIWLRRNLQQALFETLRAYRSLPYNADGYNAIYQGAQSIISQGLSNGVIRVGVTLSPAQQAEVDRQAGVAIAEELSSKGWYLQVADPITTTVRTERGSPVVNFWYCDGGSIQKLSVSATTVL